MKGLILPERMKAAVLFNHDDLRVIETSVPRPGQAEVLIKVKACAICGTDPKIVAHGWPNCPPFGEYILGHEYTGEIIALGEGVTGYKVGDRVAVEPHKGCGHCINCIRGLYTTCLNYGKVEEGHRHYGFTINGGYADYAVCHINCLHKFSEKISFDDATLITTAGTALYGLQRAGWVRPGDRCPLLDGAIDGWLPNYKNVGPTCDVVGTRNPGYGLPGNGADHTINGPRNSGSFVTP